MISINARASRIAQQMISDAAALGLEVMHLSNGATVVDAGVEAPGSLHAGKLFSEACMGGLGQVHFCELDLDGLRWPGVAVTSSHPWLSCAAAQMAGWRIAWDDESGPIAAMGSGPARALYGVEEIFAQLGYEDKASVAVLALEGTRLPPAAVAADVAAKCRIPPGSLLLLVAPAASIVGQVQVAARMVEAGLHKLLAVGFDIRTVTSAYGTCPIAPLVRDELHAIGRANDAILYGTRTWYTVDTADAVIEAIVEQLPSEASRDYGTPFYELFRRYDWDFYKIDPALFSVAEISIANLRTGRTFRAGQVNNALVRRSFLE